jgi:hypothetical protein
LRLGFVHYPETWVIPIALIIVLVFAGVVALGFRRQLLTLSGIGLGALVLVISLITAPLLVSAVWKLLSSVAPSYQATYLGHTVNESRLMIIFASITIALTITWYALTQKIRQVSAPDLTIGAFALLAIVIVGFAIVMPERSYLPAWTGLFGFLAVGYWFYSTNDASESFSMRQLVALILAAIVAVALMLPMYINAFMTSEANDWALSIVIMVLMLGLLVPQLQVITRPKKWWLPVVAWAAAAVSLVAAILG